MEAGIWPDQKLADARSIRPDLRVVACDIQADSHELEALARWMMRYSPVVALNGNDSLLLDIAGCDHLFGGEAGLIHDMLKKLDELGFSPRIGLADTVGAAIALSHCAPDQATILPAGSRNYDAACTTLDALPVDALRLDMEQIIMLRRLGLKKIGDLRTIPRVALERRFREKDAGKTARKRSHETARSVQMRLDQLSGELREPLIPLVPAARFRAVMNCPYPAVDFVAVGHALDWLLPKLSTQLEKARSGARHFRLTGYRGDGETRFVDVRLSMPTRNRHKISRLFTDRLEQIDCGFGIDLFTLEAFGITPIDALQYDSQAAARDPNESVSLANFADTLANRIGRNVVYRLAPVTSHVPERAQRRACIATAVDWKSWQEAKPVWAPRPTRLFDRPEEALVTAELPDGPPLQFVWRRVLRKIIRARGPERILPEWWHDGLRENTGAQIRDYYDVEDEEGIRYWIYRAGFAAGDKNTTPPAEESDIAALAVQTITSAKHTTFSNWYVQGLF